MEIKFRKILDLLLCIQCLVPYFFRLTLLFWFAMSCFENWSYRLLLHLTFVSSNYNVTKLKTLNKEEASREIPNTIHFWFLRDFYGVFFFRSHHAPLFSPNVFLFDFLRLQMMQMSDLSYFWLSRHETIKRWLIYVIADLISLLKEKLCCFLAFIMRHDRMLIDFLL